jgi:hypothetical protein
VIWLIVLSLVVVCVVLFLARPLPPKRPDDGEPIVD